MTLTEVKDVFSKMPDNFNANAAREMEAVIQFDISGENAGTWHVEIKQGACRVLEGTHDAPTVTLSMSDKTWLAIVNRESNAVKAFMSGRLKVKGDIMLAQRIPDLFSL